MASLSVNEAKSSAVARATSCEPAIEAAYLESWVLENDDDPRTIKKVCKCLESATPSCVVSQEKISEAIKLRGGVVEKLKDAKTFEKDGYPLYDGVNLSNMQEGLGILYVKMLNNCKVDEFIEVANMLGCTDDCRPSLKEIDKRWSKFEKTIDEPYSSAQTHIRYLSGNNVHAAKLLIIAGQPLSLVKKLFPVE